MSQSLTLELSEQVFVAIQQQAQMIGISPAQLAATLLERQFQQAFKLFLATPYNKTYLDLSAQLQYWLRLLSATDILPESRIQSLQSEAEEIMKIIGAIFTSSKK